MLKIKFSSGKIFLLIIGLIFSIIILEVIIGKYLRKPKLNKKLEYIEKTLNSHKLDIGCYDRDLGWGFKPGAKGRSVTSEFDVIYSINSKGIRDKEISFENPGNKFRIVALGESTVFGQGVNYGRRFTEVIEKAFKNVEVVNMGVWGFGMDQSFLQLQRDGFKYNPDLIVLFIIRDYLERCKDFIRIGAFKPRFVLAEDKSGLILQDMKFVKDNFSSKASLKLDNLSDRMGKAEKSSQEEKDREYWRSIYRKLSEEKKIRKKYSRNDFNRLIFFLLKKYKNACRNQKVDLLVVYIGDDDINYINKFCQTLDIPYIDLSAVLIRASKFKPLRFGIDPHYNDFTHKVIGEYVSEYIEDKYNLKKNKDYIYEFLDKFKDKNF